MTNNNSSLFHQSSEIKNIVNIPFPNSQESMTIRFPAENRVMIYPVGDKEQILLALATVALISQEMRWFKEPAWQSDAYCGMLIAKNKLKDFPRVSLNELRSSFPFVTAALTSKATGSANLSSGSEATNEIFFARGEVTIGKVRYAQIGARTHDAMICFVHQYLVWRIRVLQEKMVLSANPTALTFTQCIAFAVSRFQGSAIPNGPNSYNVTVIDSTRSVFKKYGIDLPSKQFVVAT